ncbi:putative serine/threonine-protein kinase K06H7.1 [Aphelenchoides bicaudatus]|nr:putative serine/threonine-protein kinase K06H7.1 [Aphelenchoides bicaudatus]
MQIQAMNFCNILKVCALLMLDLDENEAGPVNLPPGKIFRKSWKVVEKLAEGGCGAVYVVEDIRTKQKAALKAESNFVAGGSLLKMEVQVLNRLQGRKFFAQLISSGKKERYSYMIMSLFGASLYHLFKQCNSAFTVGTQIRLGIQILYGLKQLHEVGYIHRDIKPANLAIGRRGAEARMVHLLDFGLVREYVLRRNGKLGIRKLRRNTLFRGTRKYCSANAHTRNEQGRQDDLWSMLYVLVEMRCPLPWSHLKERHEIGRLKSTIPDAKLLVKCPPQMLLITRHLRTLNYYKRPDYQLIFKVLVHILNACKVKYSDPFDWELLASSSGVKRKSLRILSVTEDSSVAQSNEEDKNQSKEYTAEERIEPNALPFNVEDFAKNELGF